MPNVPFTSRQSLIQNLGRALQAGKPALMIGGPMIGKSTLTRQMCFQLKNTGSHIPIYVDLEHMRRPDDFWSIFMRAVLEQVLGPDQKNPYRKVPDSMEKLLTQLHYFSEKKPESLRRKKFVVLIDDCDRLLPGAAKYVSQIENMRLELMAPSVEAICWIGGLPWLDWVDAHQACFMTPLRRYPLSVVPVREAKSIIREHMGAEKVASVWAQTGGHPLLLQKWLGGVENKTIGLLNRRMWTYFRSEEKAVLKQLDPEGKWQVLDALRTEEGTKPPKSLLDRLSMAGAIVRTLDHGTAVLRLTSPLIREKAHSSLVLSSKTDLYDT